MKKIKSIFVFKHIHVFLTQIALFPLNRYNIYWL